MFPFLQLFERFNKQFATRAFADKQPPLPAATSGTALVHVRQRTGSTQAAASGTVQAAGGNSSRTPWFMMMG
jgi:hypothetical protein